ncbi:PH domain-containing protein [Streptomyces sp. NPDC091292]|uniref:PH domain-containing protein n=1 Tax=Streptomyces sp. NPDC091292 TaxID=3365991 RepID=UPI00382B3896
MPPSPAPLAPPALPVTFRPGRTRAVLLVSGVVLLVALTVIALILPDLNPGERLSFVFVGLICLASLALLARPKVTADPSGVTVVNIASRRRLDWAEILQVNLRPGDPWVFLDLSDGTSLAAMGIQPGIAREQAIRDARALRALVETRGGSDTEGHAAPQG